MYLSEEVENPFITPNHLIYGLDIDRSGTVKHYFNEVSGDDMRKRQACKVKFKHFTKRFI